MREIERTEEEIEEQVSRAYEQIEKGTTRYRGMTYEQGVQEALDWVTGVTEDEPLTEKD